LVTEGKPVQSTVNFFEKLQANPNEDSKEQLYRYVEKHGIELFDDGDMILFKGCLPGTPPTSRNTGKATVNGEEHDGHIPNPDGAIVEMPRSEVTFDPKVSCAQGLHVGTHKYASGFTSGPTLKVRVNPRDIVSVPRDHNEQKIRTCRYLVVGQI
jgi:hypothetical protein